MRGMLVLERRKAMLTVKKLNPFSMYQDYITSLVDSGQRSVLYWDVMRRLTLLPSSNLIFEA